MSKSSPNRLLLLSVAICVLFLAPIVSSSLTLSHGDKDAVEGPVILNMQIDAINEATSSEFINEDDVSEANVPPVSVSPSPSPANETAKKETIADVIDQALIKEFDKEEKKMESEAGKNFNETSQKDEARLETVVRISANSGEDSQKAKTEAAADASESGMTQASKSKTQPDPSIAPGGVASGEEDAPPEKKPIAATTDLPKLDRSVDRIIDSQDNEFVLSNPKESVAALTLDPQLVQDLTFLLAAAAGMGMVFESMKQPVINGYLVAGAVVGPGGFKVIKELVQVESLAQVGVLLLLFGLGLELSLSRLRAVWGAAIIGGLMQIMLLVIAMGALAAAMGASVGQGLFLGAVVSMSSTSVVVKCLETSKTTNSSYGQIVIGTLLLQDCCVGLMFALMPVFTLNTAALPAGEVAERNAVIFVMVLKLLLKLVAMCLVALALVYTIIPPLLRLIIRTLSKELVQLTLVGICLLSAWSLGQFGLSEELGAFVAGAILSGSRAAADMHLPSSITSPVKEGTREREEAANKGGKLESVHAALHSIGSLQNVMAALFVASIGMVMSPTFLWHHISVLTAGTLVVVSVKALLVSVVVHLFGVAPNIALAVGMSMAHIGEFGLVLLSMANQHSLISNHVYMLLLGVTALSLLLTPMVIMACNRLVRTDSARYSTLPRHEKLDVDQVEHEQERAPLVSHSTSSNRRSPTSSVNHV